jgi:predicted nucleic acid-binding protein
MASYLVDTNIVLRILHRTDPRHAMVRGAVRTLRTHGHALQAASQNFTEFWHACTRPISQNGFGLTPIATERLLRLAERLFPLLPDAATIYPEWRRLVIEYGVSGVQVYDARLAAAMIIHHVTHILTFNTADFARYAPEGIVAVDPTTV